jgi:hypothetical protein
MNCKPGDLAYIVRASEFCADCIGRIVKVLGVASGPTPFAPDIACWDVEFVGPEPASIRFQLAAGSLPGATNCPDDCLRPINGVRLRDEQLDEVPHATE